MTALDPADAEAHFHLGLVAFRDGRYVDARQSFARVVELQPSEPAGYLNLALALEALARPAEARLTLEALLRRAPECGPARLHLAILRYDAGEHAEALALLETVEVDGSLRMVADFYVAMLHALFWDLRTARERLAAIPAEGQSARILNNLGAVLERGDRLEEARLTYAAALDRGGAAALARKNLGDLYFREGRADLARKSYLLALHDDPGNAEALTRLGQIADREGQRGEAVAYWERALQADGGHEHAARELSRVRAPAHQA